MPSKKHFVVLCNCMALLYHLAQSVRNYDPK